MAKDPTTPRSDLPTEATPATLTGPSQASLVLIHGGALGRRYVLQGDTTMGRDPGSTIAIDLKSVSRQHARLLERDGAWYVCDLGSTNGTFVDSREIVGDVPLTKGALLKLGGAIFKFLEGGNVEALYHEEIHRLTIFDSLTGVHNKRSFMDFLEREVARSLRHYRPLSLVLMDIDHFKQVNDTHGHLAGDYVLQTLAQLISTHTRRDELFARYGGDEFAFILPETEVREASQLSQRIRELTQAHVFTFDEEVIPVTVSMGVASMNPSYDADGLIEAADRLLYQAKQAGRNRVMSEQMEST